MKASACCRNASIIIEYVFIFILNYYKTKAPLVLLIISNKIVIKEGKLLYAIKKSPDFMIAGQSEIYIYKHINDLVKFSLIIIYSVLRHKFKLFSVVVYAENTRRNAFFLPGFLGS